MSRALAALLVGVLACLAGSAGPAFGDSLSDQRRATERKAAANKQARDALAASLEDISSQLSQAILDLQVVEQRLPEAQAELATAQATFEQSQREATIIAARLQDAKDQETTITSTIATDTAHGEQVRASIGQMARAAYRGGTAVSSVGIVLGAQSTEDFVAQYGLVTAALRTQNRTLDDMKSIEANNRNSQARLEAVRDRVTELKAAADQKVIEADQAKAAAAARQAEIQQLVADQTAKKASIEAQKAAAEAEQAAADAEATAVANELAQIIAQQRAAGKLTGAAGPIGDGIFGNPTVTNPIYVTSEYGMRMHPILHIWRLHAGIDLRTGCGTNIYAARAGTVQWAQLRSGYGNQVMVDHGTYNGNSLMSSYNHMTSFVVHAGQQVDQGQLLGYSGNTGTSAACHLHFEVYVNGATVNPRPLLGL